MNETGPEAVPPPASSSLEDRMVDRLVPVPDPYLTSIHSVRASTSCCSKTTSPFSLAIVAERVSHCTSSKAGTPGRVKYRFQGRPLGLRFGAAPGTLTGRSVDCFWVGRGMDWTSAQRVKALTIL